MGVEVVDVTCGGRLGKSYRGPPGNRIRSYLRVGATTTPIVHSLLTVFLAGAIAVKGARGVIICIHNRYSSLERVQESLCLACAPLKLFVHNQPITCLGPVYNRRASPRSTS